MLVLCRFDNLMFNPVMVMCVLLTCEKLGDIDPAKEIHVFIVRGGFDLDVFVGIALINMYYKCNNMYISCQVCEKMLVKNVVALTTMISRHVENGFFQDVVELFLTFLLDFGICFNLKLLYFRPIK